MDLLRGMSRSAMWHIGNNPLQHSAFTRQPNVTILDDTTQLAEGFKRATQLHKLSRSMRKCTVTFPTHTLLVHCSRVREHTTFPCLCHSIRTALQRQSHTADNKQPPLLSIHSSNHSISSKPSKRAALTPFDKHPWHPSQPAFMPIEVLNSRALQLRIHCKSAQTAAHGATILGQTTQIHTLQLQTASLTG